MTLRIQARLVGKGYNPVTTKLCLGVVLKKVLDGTDTFHDSIVLIIMFLCLDLSEFTSLQQNELSAVEKSAHLYLLSFSFVVPKSHLHYTTNQLKVWFQICHLGRTKSYSKWLCDNVFFQYKTACKSLSNMCCLKSITYLVAPSSYVAINTIVPSWMVFRNSISGATSGKKEHKTV